MQLRRFFELDALAFASGGIVGGACPPHLEGKKLKHLEKHIHQFVPLLKAFGMDKDFRYECPTEEEKASGEAVMMGEGGMARQNYTLLYSHEWLENLRARYAPPRLRKREDGRLRIAVHVRRGDINMCNTFKWRYLPNKFYLEMFDLYLPSICGVNVTETCYVEIHSVSKSLESFRPFINRGFIMKLDSDLEDTWRAFMTADVVFASRSTFSWAPSFLNTDGRIIFPQYPEHHPMGTPPPGWEVIPSNSKIIKEAVFENVRLAQELGCYDPAQRQYYEKAP